MNRISNIKVLYFNDWLIGSWQVQKIHAQEFLGAFNKQPDIEVFPFPKIPATENGDIHIKVERHFLNFTKQFIKRATPFFLKGTLDEISCTKNRFKIQNYINKIEPDLIIARHNANFSPLLYKLTNLKQPLILEINALITHDLARANHRIPTKVSRLEKDVIRKSDAVFSVCRGTSEMIKELGADPQKVFTVPNGVDPNKFSPRPKLEQLCNKYGLSGNSVIGYVGGFVKGKSEPRDVLCMLEAFKIAKMNCEVPVKMLMIGKMEEEYLWKEIKRFGIADSVVFTGLIEHACLPEFMNLIDIAVAPYFERHIRYGSPVKLFEYMAMEKPTIIPKVGQPARILKNWETAVLIKPESPSSMAKALLMLIRNTFERKKIGRNARRLILSKYTWEHNARNIANICHLVLEKEPLGVNDTSVSEMLQPQ